MLQFTTPFGYFPRSVCGIIFGQESQFFTFSCLNKGEEENIASPPNPFSNSRMKKARKNQEKREY